VDRAKVALEAGVQFMVCIHYDSTPWTPHAHGLHAYYPKDDDLAKEVAFFALKNAPPPLRGGRAICAHDNPDIREDDWKRDAEYLCEVYRCPTILLEFGYLSNPNDLKYLRRTDGIEDCAALVLQCIEHARQLIGARDAQSSLGPLDPLSNL
jgi:N-acetylmuramoyl-L-alanine amidase